MRLDITAKGIELILNCFQFESNGVGEDTLVPEIKFTRILYGNGENASPNATALSNKLYEFDISRLIRVPESEFVTLETKFNNNEIENTFENTEIGIMVADSNDPDNRESDILFAYGYAPPNSVARIPARSDSILETTQRFMVYVGTVENVTVEINESFNHVGREEFDEHKSADNPHGITVEKIGAAPASHTHTVDSSLSDTSENPVQNKVVKEALDGKVEKEDGKGLSSNDYTTEEKEKLEGLPENAATPEDVDNVKTLVVTYSTSSNTLDKTFDEILEAINSRKDVVIYSSDGQLEYHLMGVHYLGNYIRFFRPDDPNNIHISVIGILQINSNNTVDRVGYGIKGKFVTGTYNGTATSSGYGMNINIGFKPSLVMVYREGFFRYDVRDSTTEIYEGIVTASLDIIHDNALSITNDGFFVSNSSSDDNKRAFFDYTGVTYHYVAFP